MPGRHRSHEFYMRTALKLARMSRSLTYPNPAVGCVVVRGGRIIGKGFHRGPGSNHAEVEALAQAGSRARGAALYVTLEPCCHFGRTPPCTDSILRSGIREVYYALKDPNPAVAGRGARLLERHGLRVHRGIRSREAAGLNEVYLKFRATGLPFVTAKVATSLDGKIATRTGQSKWITDAQARRRARQLRAQHQGVVAGVNTILADDPHLGPRIPGADDPWRIILDSHLRIPLESKVVQSGRCIVACTYDASAAKKARLQRRGVKVMAFKGKRVPLKLLLSALAQEGIISLLVEGGGEVLGSFFDLGLVDRVCWFLSPVILGSTLSRVAIGGIGVARLADAWRLRKPTIERVGQSWLIQGNLSRYALRSSDGLLSP